MPLQSLTTVSFTCLWLHNALSCAMRSTFCDCKTCTAVADLHPSNLSQQLHSRCAAFFCQWGCNESVAHLPQDWDSPIPHFVDIHGHLVGGHTGNLFFKWPPPHGTTTTIRGLFTEGLPATGISPGGATREQDEDGRRPEQRQPAHQDQKQSRNTAANPSPRYRDNNNNNNNNNLNPFFVGWGARTTTARA